MRLSVLLNKRVLIAVLLLLAGLGMLGYGARFNSQVVLMEQEVELPPPPGFGGELPFSLPPIVETVPLEESEPRLIREVSIGGVSRLPSGEIQRTYRGAAPTQCPT
jgi:hypothetical protein